MKRVISVFLMLVLMVSAVNFTFTASAGANGYTTEAADWFVKVALAEVGYKEGSNNSNKYGEWFGNNNTGWCAMFVAWCANQTDVKYKSKVMNTAVPKQAGCTGSMNWFKNNGLYKTRSSGYVPKRGDLIYFDWNPGTGLDHIGIVTGTSVSSGVTYVNTVEGNTSNMVNTRKYKLSSSSIIGYGVFDSNRVDYSNCTPKNTSSSGSSKPTVSVPQNIPVTLTRLSGQDRFLTSEKIAQTGWQTASTVILATSKSFRDALTASSLSGLYDAPILITAGASSLEASIASRIKALSPSNVIIIGGTSAVSTSIENQLKASYTVTRIAGEKDSTVEVAKYLIKNSSEAISTAVLVNGTAYADALSISPVAAIGKYPILFSDGKSISQETRVFLTENNISNVIIVGGAGVVSDDVANALKTLGMSVDRVYGANRFKTCVAVYNKFKSIFGNDYSIATGMNYPDALSGSAFAAKSKTALLLTQNGTIPAEISEIIKGNSNTKKLYLLGGEGVLPENSIRLIYA